jgi:aminoglycoside phosphotransferase (APT) family kinase protein
MRTEQPPTDRPALDPRAILAALGHSDAERITPVAGGADAALWRVDTAAEPFALRVLQPHQRTQAQNEIAAMAAAAAGGVPVPRIAATGTWQDHPALVLGWCPGLSLAESMLTEPTRGERLGLAFGRTQALLHAIPAPPGLPHPPDAWIEWARPDDALRARLTQLATSRPRLLHLDYHPLNVLVDGDQITAVLDWANARGGDPRADLARTASILHFAPLPDTVPAKQASAFRRTCIAAWRTGYRETGASVRQIAPFYAWAGQAMIHDLSPRLGRADVPWLTVAYLDRVDRWAAQWRRRAGL